MDFISNIFKELTKPFITQPRLVPALFALLILVLLLFSPQELPENIIKHLIPALVVYCLGVALIQTIHRLKAIENEKPGERHENESTIPRWLAFMVYFCHITLLVLFTFYLFKKDVL
ncbi:hypothetical protein ACFLZ9_01120 [Patescibacteria group bacterium]